MAVGFKSFASGLLGLFGASAALSPTDANTRDSLQTAFNNLTQQMTQLKDEFSSQEQSIIRQQLDTMITASVDAQKVVNATFSGEITDNQLAIMSLFAFVVMLILYLLTEE
jgi:predicted PurR-regulated permease PerM